MNVANKDLVILLEEMIEKTEIRLQEERKKLHKINVLLEEIKSQEEQDEQGT